MKAKLRTTAICVLAMSLLMSGCGKGQALGPTRGSKVYPDGEEAVSYYSWSNATPPILFFTDLTSGPKTGGQNDLGVFITLYGEGFGAQRDNSTVAIGGIEVAKYVSWGQDNGIARNLDMIVIQPGPDVVSGNIVVTVNGHASNPLPFAVRSGSIYFVIPDAPNADDTNPGTYSEPFKTIYRPRQVMLDGDVVYIKGGTFSQIDPANPSWDAILILDADTAANGTAERPIAYIGYPGDSPVLANPAARVLCACQYDSYTILESTACDRNRTPYHRQLFARRCV